MTVRRLVLHVGLPKTGTTALQMWCHANRDHLLTQGIRYPLRHVDETYQKHQFIVTALMQNNLTMIRDALEEGGEETILLSTEGMTNHLYDFSPAALASFRALVGAFDVTVFVVTRAPDAWIRSYYKQCLINPRNDDYHYATTLELAEFSRLQRVRRLVDMSTLAEDLAAAYGARDVVVADYDRGWMTAFLEVIGASAERAPALEHKNASIPDWMIPLIQQLNCLHLTAETRAEWLVIIMSCFGVGSNILRAYSTTPGHDCAGRIELALLDRLKVASDEQVWAVEQLRQHLRKRAIGDSA